MSPGAGWNPPDTWRGEQIGECIRFLTFQLAWPLAERHEEFSFHDRSNLEMAVAKQNSSSRTLQVLQTGSYLSPLPLIKAAASTLLLHFS